MFVYIRIYNGIDYKTKNFLWFAITDPYVIVPYVAAPVTVVEETSDDGRSFDGRAERTRGFGERSPPAVAAHRQQTHPAEDSACCRHRRTAGMESDAHYLENIHYKDALRFPAEKS